MIPATEADTISPSPGGEIVYSEAMATSYRNRNFTAAFPFGHGLTYTDFRYGVLASSLTRDTVCIHLSIQNVGKVAAGTVVQLYLEFPRAARHPAPLLKGFQKIDAVAPGASMEVLFQLRDRDLSYYDNGRWVKATMVTAHVGAS